MEAMTTSTVGEVRPHARARFMMLFLLIVAVAVVTLWAVWPISQQTQTAAAPAVPHQGIQCDEQCRAGFIQLGVIPPPVTGQGGSVRAPVFSTPGRIQCDEQCRQGFIQLGVIPPGE